MNLIIAAGGSGGHIFPAIAFGHAVRQLDKANNILFITGTKDIDISILKSSNFRTQCIDVAPMKKVLSLSFAVFLIKLIKGIFRSFIIIGNFKPDVVVGFGGFVSAPVIISSFLTGRPAIIHEQNLIPGRANKILYLFADKVAISFRETEKLFSSSEKKAKKIVFTGNPIRPDLMVSNREDSFGKLSLHKDRFTIMVMGGSQGSHAINDAAYKAITGLGFNRVRHLQIIHITGKKDFDYIKDQYSRYETENRTFSFYEDMAVLYSVSDLIISRAGATSIAEISYYGKPSILIPYPYARAHQVDNARVLSKAKAAIMIEEKDLSPETLRSKLVELLEDRVLLGNLSSRAGEFNVKDAARRLAEETLRLAKKT